MRFAHPELDFYIDSNENEANVLIIENGTFLYRLVSELGMQIETSDGRFVLSDKNDILPLNKNMILITDLFHFDSNQKKILTKIYSSLSETARDEFYSLSAQTMAQNEQFICELLDNYPSQLEYSAPTVEGLIKLFGVKVYEGGESLLEKLTDHIKLLNETFNISYFVIYSLHSMLNEEELKQFYSFTFMRKYVILSLEPYPITPLDCERVYIVDKDLCSVF